MSLFDQLSEFDCAQTLFMGATNIIVEGTTDQFLINELVRHFANPDNLGQLIDLNSVVLTSANGAGGPEQLLSFISMGVTNRGLPR